MPRDAIARADAPLPSDQACLNAPDSAPGNENGVDNDQVESPDEPTPHSLPPQTSRPGLPQNPHMPAGYGMPSVPMDPTQAMAYQNYVQQRGGGYAMPSHSSHQS